MAKARQKKSDALTRLDKLIGERFTFALNLRSIREAEEITQAEFAATLGVSPAHLCAVEKGHKAVSVERAAAWARVLGQSEAQFVKLALQDELDRAGLDYLVELADAS